MRQLFARFRPPPSSAVLVALVGLLLTPADAQAKTGAELFQVCAACHSIGAGRLVGPDLAGVTDRRSREWLHEFIPASQKMVARGEPGAVAIFEEFGKFPMPDQALTSSEIDAILGHIEATGVSAGDAAAPPVAPEPAAATADQILLGQNLFTGETRLAKNGPACVSCHDVTHDAIIGGGILAPELTTVFGRLGGVSVRAILGSQPFPVMEAAYKDRSLTEDEVVALVGFLEDVSKNQKDHMPRDTGLKLAASGAVGTIALLFIYSLLWKGRKRGSVNQDIYDRQVKSI